MREIAISNNNVPIRLTDERWHHISTGHPEIADYYYEILEAVENPRFIYKGNYDSLIAVGAKIEQSGKFIVVVYKEISNSDGFIITAYISGKDHKFRTKK